MRTGMRDRQLVRVFVPDRYSSFFIIIVLKEVVLSATVAIQSAFTNPACAERPRGGW